MKSWEAVAILTEVERSFRGPLPPPKGKSAWLTIPIDTAMEILRAAVRERTDPAPEPGRKE